MQAHCEAYPMPCFELRQYKSVMGSFAKPTFFHDNVRDKEDILE